MSFLKHVGIHQDRKVAILYRQVPNEDHMCLVIYPQVLPAPWHDAIMRVLESDVGQQAEEFATALHRNFLPDGRNILETLHQEKMIKKIRTADVNVTPRQGASIRLDELNAMLTKMKQGEEAIKEMATNDAARGLVDPSVKRTAEALYKSGRDAKTEARPTPPPTIKAGPDAALSDSEIDGNMLIQAERMEAEGKGLLAEAARMKKDAERMQPNVVPRETMVIRTDSDAKPKRGRPSKAKAVADAAQ